VSKGSRNRQLARAKIAQMRAQQARRRRRRNWLVGAGAAAVVVIAAVAILLAVTRGGSNASAGGTPQLKLGSLASLGTLRPAPAPGAIGPEGVPVPSAAPLASTTAAATGGDVDGIKCQTSEQAVLHIHAHLTIFVNGSPRQIPAGVGIPGARPQNTAQGLFASGGSCFYWLHTHAADGIIHVESPVQRTYTLGDFFGEWGQPLGPRQVGPPPGTSPRSTTGSRTRGTPATSR
jgi:hypothetical protein